MHRSAFRSIQLTPTSSHCTGMCLPLVHCSNISWLGRMTVPMRLSRFATRVPGRNTRACSAVLDFPGIGISSLHRCKLLKRVAYVTGHTCRNARLEYCLPARCRSPELNLSSPKVKTTQQALILLLNIDILNRCSSCSELRLNCTLVSNPASKL